MTPDRDRTEEIREAIRAHATFSASRAGGPGGQHVNTSATRVELRIPVAALPLSQAERARVRTRLGGRLTADDEIRVAIATERSQLMNRRRAEEVLIDLISRARRTAPPRRPTRPTRASESRRRRAKERRSQVKSQRRSPPESE